LPSFAVWKVLNRPRSSCKTFPVSMADPPVFMNAARIIAGRRKKCVNADTEIWLKAGIIRD
jgi:hypothetical protein